MLSAMEKIKSCNNFLSGMCGYSWDLWAWQASLPRKTGEDRDLKDKKESAMPTSREKSSQKEKQTQESLSSWREETEPGSLKPAAGRSAATLDGWRRWQKDKSRYWEGHCPAWKHSALHCLIKRIENGFVDLPKASTFLLITHYNKCVTSLSTVSLSLKGRTQMPMGIAHFLQHDEICYSIPPGVQIIPFSTSSSSVCNLLCSIHITFMIAHCY